MRVAFNAFLGVAPRWYKLTILVLLALNPLVLAAAGPVVSGWLMLLEFIFILAMTLQCYPLQPGGLLALESVLMGLTDPAAVYAEVVTGFPVILLLVFMVAGVYFLKDMLLAVFTRLLLAVRSKAKLSLWFTLSAAALSAFLDALTVVAVVIAVAVGFYGVYHRAATGKGEEDEHDMADDSAVRAAYLEDLIVFRAFLRSLMMHAAVGTALGGVCTLVGEPQNLLIGLRAGWDFGRFFWETAPVSLPALVAGLALCWVLETFGWFGYGAKLPQRVRDVLAAHERRLAQQRDPSQRYRIAMQAVVALILVVALGFHVAEVGLVGLLIIVLATAFTGVVEEHRLGQAFHEALPFTALLVVFFVIVSFIHGLHLFEPVTRWVLSLDGSMRLAMFYLANGVLSSISDNVFVATIFIEELKRVQESGVLTPQQFDSLVVALNTGTNLASVATPNGQAAFLFLLSSALAPLIRLSYARMVWMALPYFLVVTGVGLAAVAVALPAH